MKKFLLSGIRFYQKYISCLKTTKCPYFPSCSEYGYEAVEKYELFAELLKGISCVFDETRETIFDRTIKMLEEDANKKYSALTEGNQSSGGRLVFKKDHDVVHVSIRDINNGVITGLGHYFIKDW